MANVQATCVVAHGVGYCWTSWGLVVHFVFSFSLFVLLLMPLGSVISCCLFTLWAMMLLLAMQAAGRTAAAAQAADALHAYMLLGASSSVWSCMHAVQFP